MEVSFDKLSFAAWVKPADLSGIQTIIDEGGATNGIALRIRDNVLEAAVRNGQTQFTTPALTIPADGGWHHVAMTYDLGVLKIYLDGIFSSEITASYTTISPTQWKWRNWFCRWRFWFWKWFGRQLYRLDGRCRYYFEKALTAGQVADIARNDGDRTALYMLVIIR
ncbi:MAG: LamG domain-containing protein [Saprospiraceae bacterium]